MTEFGLTKVDAAKRTGNWELDPHPKIGRQTPRDLSAALAHNKQASAFFQNLAPTYRKQFIAWIATAKRPETRARRLKESLALLAHGKRLGLK